ncbi:MAG: alpha/beta fold hydrolase [Christensenellaceae bacterium]|nr:alpha/beta fold hydrolase [Christensenellaceae bacterium]
MDKRPTKDFTAPECQPFLMEGGDHGVLLIHGFTGSAGHMRLIGEGLHAQGFTVRGINLPGHAESMEAMGKTDWQDWLGAARSAAAELKEKCGRVSVAGLSMGGVLTLLLAEEMELTACAPISAPMAVQNKLMPFAKLAAPFIPMTWWGGDPERPSMLDDRYDYGYPGFPTKCAASLAKLIKMARGNLHAITCPILAVQSHADETISADSADVIMAGVSSRVKGTLWLEKVPHVCTISPEHSRIAEAIGELLRRAEQIE